MFHGEACTEFCFESAAVSDLAAVATAMAWSPHPHAYRLSLATLLASAVAEAIAANSDTAYHYNNIKSF